jgi:hypothetical protein
MANSWEETGRRSLRQRRSKEMEGGRSPPPKLKEENIFSEGDSRASSRPAYQVEESKNNWGWGDESDEDKEKTLSSIFGEISQGVFDPTKNKKSVPVKINGWRRNVKRPSISEVGKVSEDTSESSGEDSSVEDEGEGSVIYFILLFIFASSFTIFALFILFCHGDGNKNTPN